MKAPLIYAGKDGSEEFDMLHKPEVVEHLLNERMPSLLTMFVCADYRQVRQRVSDRSSCPWVQALGCTALLSGAFRFRHANHPRMSVRAAPDAIKPVCACHGDIQSSGARTLPASQLIPVRRQCLCVVSSQLSDSLRKDSMKPSRGATTHLTAAFRAAGFGRGAGRFIRRGI